MSQIITTQELIMERETKGTVLYITLQDSPNIRNLYIPKRVLPTPYPKRIVVKVEVVDE